MTVATAPDHLPETPRLSLVLPAFNEQARLPYTLDRLRAFLTTNPLDAEVIVVDNGSTDATSAVVQQTLPYFPGLRLLRTDRRGKGRAVRTGMLAARGKVVLFADADLSWSLDDISRLADLTEQQADIVIGSREGPGSSRVDEPNYRHIMGRAFNRVVQALVVPGIQDSQCGLKAFRGSAAREIFQRQTIDGFAFDVEVLFIARLRGYRILEVPITWEHKENSRVQPFVDTVRMLRDVLRVRLNALQGRYK